jgi:hypothetical protein
MTPNWRKRITPDHIKGFMLLTGILGFGLLGELHWLLYPPSPPPLPERLIITPEEEQRSIASMACDKRNEARLAMLEAHDLESGNLVVIRTPEETDQAAGVEDCMKILLGDNYGDITQK